jgi:hypothetical protein
LPSAGAREQRVSFVGSFFPFARTRAEREHLHDPRLSIEERYADRADYLRRAAAVVDSLVAQRFLLERDRNSSLERCGFLWDAVMGAAPHISARRGPYPRRGQPTPQPAWAATAKTLH